MSQQSPNNYTFTPNTTLDEALVKDADKEALLRMKAVEETVKFSMGKSPTINDIETIYTKFYNFLKDGSK